MITAPSAHETAMKWDPHRHIHTLLENWNICPWWSDSCPIEQRHKFHFLHEKWHVFYSMNRKEFRIINGLKQKAHTNQTSSLDKSRLSGFLKTRQGALSKCLFFILQTFNTLRQMRRTAVCFWQGRQKIDFALYTRGAFQFRVWMQPSSVISRHDLSAALEADT